MILTENDWLRLVKEHQGEAFTKKSLCQLAKSKTRKGFRGGTLTNGTPAEERD
jgi:hypothetical protein